MEPAPAPLPMSSSYKEYTMVVFAAVGQPDLESSLSSFADYFLLDDTTGNCDDSFSDDDSSTVLDDTGREDVSNSAYDLDALEESSSGGGIDEFFINVCPVSRKATKRSKLCFKKVRFGTEEIRYYEELQGGRTRIVRQILVNLLEEQSFQERLLPFSEERWSTLCSPPRKEHRKDCSFSFSRRKTLPNIVNSSWAREDERNGYH